MILHLSFSKAESVNEAVIRDVFNGTRLMLQFPTTYDIIDKIKHTLGSSLLSKTDISKVFWNLHGNPVDAFRFGINWVGHFFLDIMAAFSWVHGSASFKMTSDPILHIIGQENCDMFAYIDDFIMVHPENDSEHHFKKLFLSINSSNK